MKKRLHGPSRYYASDKNVFDALNQHKVDIPTIMKLFQRRNVIVSPKTPKEELASYFARLTHDYNDHKDISTKLGIAPRRERVTSMDIGGISAVDDIRGVVEQLKQELESTGDVVHLERKGDDLMINIQYSTVDYKLSEFTQVQVRDGTIEFVKSEDGYVVRNTDNKAINGIRESLFGRIEKSSITPLKKTVVGLFNVPSPKLRSKFFYELSRNLVGYVHQDVKAVYTYKMNPMDLDEDLGVEDESDMHVERVSLNGSGVSRSEILSNLLDNEDYYIVKIGWTVAEMRGDGAVYEIEAAFSDLKDCTDFSFILKAVHPVVEGKVSKQRRSPNVDEINAVSRAIEAKSRELVKSLNEEQLKLNEEDS